MKPFHICLIQPQGYVHSGAFYELSELVGLGLTDLGHKCTIRLNAILPASRNIVLGCHLLDPAYERDLLPDTIILNTEQLPRNTLPWVSTILDWSQRFDVWDYSPLNRTWMMQKGVKAVRQLGIGFHRDLMRIPKGTEDIDVLFYGSINGRRRAILERLEQAGLIVQNLFGVYGQERDNWIARSKLVLNMHFHDAKIFEIVRMHYLMNNAKAVVGEVGSDTVIDKRYLDGFEAVAYDGLVDACVALSRDTERRKTLEQQGYETLAKMPQSQFMARILSEA